MRAAPRSGLNWPIQRRRMNAPNNARPLTKQSICRSASASSSAPSRGNLRLASLSLPSRHRPSITALRSTLPAGGTRTNTDSNPSSRDEWRDSGGRGGKEGRKEGEMRKSAFQMSRAVYLSVGGGRGTAGQTDRQTTLRTRHIEAKPHFLRLEDGMKDGRADGARDSERATRRRRHLAGILQ